MGRFAAMNLEKIEGEEKAMDFLKIVLKLKKVKFKRLSDS